MSLHVTASALEDLLAREWISVNHIGGYASSTPVGLNTRKYHGLLVAAMTPPVRRMVLLSHVEETIHAGGRSFSLSTCEYPNTIHPKGYTHLVAFASEPFPRWAYQGEGWTIQKELHMVPGRNIVCISYTLLGGTASVELDLRPMLALRGIHELMYQSNRRSEAVQIGPGQYRIDATNKTPEVFFSHDGAYESQPLWYLNNIYRRERERGYSGLEDIWTPGVVRWTLQPGRRVRFACSADPVSLEEVVAEVERLESAIDVPSLSFASDPAAAALLRAAEMFVNNSVEQPPKRSAMTTQYPWSAPSGRDALIAFAGLYLVPRKFDQAKAMLESVARELWNGLLPSCLPEDGGPAVYHGADVSLWFVHSFWQFLKYTGEDASAHPDLVEAVGKIIEAYRHGTGLGIAADTDGLLTTHLAGHPTTWMDAKAGDWVVTPRQGRPVELNALWYNAVCVASDLMRATGHVPRAEEYAMLAVSMKHAFNRRFWNEHARCCFDVVHDHGVDPSIRPNQLLAISLPHPVLTGELHSAVLNVVRSHLLTAVGLRSLSPHDPCYCGRYEGDWVTRDRAYHQGSVYPWLLGAYADATLRVRGALPAVRQQIREELMPCIDHLRGDGLGQLCELFDGEVPRRPGGAVASARSVAEVLRAYVETVLAIGPGKLEPVSPKVNDPSAQISA